MKSGLHSLNSSSSAFVAPASYPAFRQKSIWTRLGSTVEKAATWAVSYLLGNVSPRIQEKRDRTGAFFFEVFDPITHQTHQFESKAEVRIWLEKRYSL